jgi:hypothetical protein
MTHITIEREKLERVLEALEVMIMKHYELTGEVLHKETYAVLEEALAQPAPVLEPVALIRTWHKNGDQHAELVDWGMALQFLPDGEHCLYTTPPAAQQEPVAWPCHIIEADFSERTITLGMECGDYKVSSGTHWLSTTPPQRTWVDLTDDEIQDCDPHEDCWHLFKIARAVLAKSKEKNT